MKTVPSFALASLYPVLSAVQVTPILSLPQTPAVQFQRPKPTESRIWVRPFASPIAPAPHWRMMHPYLQFPPSSEFTAPKHPFLNIQPRQDWYRLISTPLKEKK
jgi:hypothetical protein